MSQSQSSTADSQALLQSMLQKLKLQPPKEGQAHLHLSAPVTSAAESGQDGVEEAAELQGSGSETNIAVNGFMRNEQERAELGTNGALQKMQMGKWDSREEFEIPAWGSGFGPVTFSFKGRERQENKLGHGFQMDRTSISSSSPKANISSETGEREVIGQATPTGTTRSLQDADVTSIERTKDEIEGKMDDHSNSAMINHNPGGMNAVATAVGQSQDRDQGFKPRVYAWASNTDEAQLLPENGIGEIGGWAESKDTQTGLDSENTANSSMTRKNKFRLSDNKTKRWTQKIKERWKERPGSLRKKAKEGGMIDQQETHSLLQNQIPTTGSLVDPPDMGGEGTLLSPDKSDTRLTLSEEHDHEEQSRSNSDFEFGLGSFSLLEEIVTGQEWAKFLNPNQQTISDNHRPPQESTSQVLIATNPPDGHGAQSSLASTQHVNENYQGRFSGSESFGNAKDFGTEPTLSERTTLVGMDISEGNHVAEKVQNQSEPMEDGHSQSDMQPEESEERQLGRPPEGHSFVKPAEILLNADLKRRVQLTRKRVYASTERSGARPQTKEETDEGEETDRGASIFSPSVNGPGRTGDTQENNLVSPHMSPSAPSFTPRGVLKHSISQDSECSIFLETATKKRRVEETRRVRFSEEVLTIEPELDLFTAWEEESVTEEDSVIEEEVGVEQEAMDDIMAPARRLALPAWILALKRRNTGRKHR
ncbi:uncharacterized protein LOC143008018 [Genypterus blacodes]|uniref:uncharacterized protein LOC143008018 n=1 Tax=Genypterus blacodes TaxID=154954 RepID=UPI003F761B26